MSILHVCTNCGKGFDGVTPTPCSECDNTTFYYDIRHMFDNSTVDVHQDQGNDNNTREKVICKGCQEVIYTYDPSPADFNHTDNAADITEAMDQHVCRVSNR